MKKIYPLCLLVFIGSLLSAQTVFWSDNFDLPATCTNNAGVGWTVGGPMDEDDGSLCTNAWTIGSATLPGVVCTSGNKLYVWADGNALCGGNKNSYESDNVSDIFAISPDISTIGVTNITMTFDWRCNGDSDVDYGSIGLSNDGGNTFTWLPAKYQLQDSCTTSTINIPGNYEGIPNLAIGFQFVSNATSLANNDPPFNIDNIILKGNVTPARPVITGVIVNYDTLIGLATITVKTNGCGYTYIINTTPPDTVTNGIFANIPPGTYNITVNGDSGIVDTIISFSSVATQALNLPNGTSFEIYPNPSSANIIELVMSKECFGCDMEMIDAVGRTVYQSKVSSSRQQIDISKLSKGTYVVKVADIVRRFVRE